MPFGTSQQVPTNVSQTSQQAPTNMSQSGSQYDNQNSHQSSSHRSPLWPSTFHGSSHRPGMTNPTNTIFKHGYDPSLIFDVSNHPSLSGSSSSSSATTTAAATRSTTMRYATEGGGKKRRAYDEEDEDDEEEEEEDRPRKIQVREGSGGIGGPSQQ